MRLDSQTVSACWYRGDLKWQLLTNNVDGVQGSGRKCLRPMDPAKPYHWVIVGHTCIITAGQDNGHDMVWRRGGEVVLRVPLYRELSAGSSSSPDWRFGGHFNNAGSLTMRPTDYRGFNTSNNNVALQLLGEFSAIADEFAIEWQGGRLDRLYTVAFEITSFRRSNRSLMRESLGIV